MATNNTTFWNLINSYKISIPIIQRDYAQGREEEFEKREKFLNAIFKHLNNNEKLHLDFIYGRVKGDTFFPIDGQQRLTTLFLLHWYFALKEPIKIEVKSKLSQFVYDTRISSREFCQCLIKEIIEIPDETGDNIFILEIKNKHWYRDKWDTDPTIRAMLVMIQAIHNRFYDISSSSVFTQLINDNTISFERLDLGEKGFELTDELYIKMNARGKQLTSFENFKANFIQLIDKYFKDKKLEHPIKGEISYSGYFSYKIEKEWTDLFWEFRGDKKTTDEGFSNYFEFITQIFFFKGYSIDFVGNNDDIEALLVHPEQDEESLLFKILNPVSAAIKGYEDLMKKQVIVAKTATVFIGNKSNNDDFVNAINSGRKNKEDIDGSKLSELQSKAIDSTNLLENTKAEILAYLYQQIQYKKHKNSKAEDFKNSFLQYEEVYCIEENLLFLFNSLDALYKIFTKNGGKKDNVNIENFYKDLFFIDNKNVESNSRIRLFWNKSEEFNLFELLIKNNEAEDISNKRRNWILQFCILQHIVRFEKYEVDEELIHYVRILRNLFQFTRYKSDTKFINDIRLNYFGDYYSVFDKLNSKNPYTNLINEEIPFKGSRFSESTIKYEIEKAKILQSDDSNIKKALLAIENFVDFGGLIHQLNPQLNQSKFQEYLKAIKEIWNTTISDTLRIQALIACGFDRLYIKNTKMGKTYYCGKKGNWSVILTNEEEKVSKSVLSLLEIYINLQVPETDKKIQAIVDSWLATNKADRSYKYYFLKYPEFTSKLNYFVWPNDYEIRILGTEGSNPLVANHISPFALTVCRRINNKTVCDEKQCYLQYSGNSPLVLKNGLTMSSEQEGWSIPVNSIITSGIISKYSLVLMNDYYLLKDNDEMDRIEIAVDFIKGIMN